MQIQKDEIRNKILDSALNIFSSIGYEAATMNQIALEAGVSKSNLYRYYQSKSEIYLTLEDAAKVEIRATLNESIDYCFGNKLLENNTPPKDPATYYLKLFSPLLCNKKKQILLILKSGDFFSGREFVDEIIGLFSEPFSLSKNIKVSGDFSKIVATSLINNVCNILCNCETDEDILTQFSSLIYYHCFGISWFADKKNNITEEP